jgi:CelD/BcsL family acetyltransferase involved in cellulose biosynthesis
MKLAVFLIHVDAGCSARPALLLTRSAFPEQCSCRSRESVADPIEFREEALPPLAVIEREWRELETVAHPSFFTSWHWIGTLLAILPEASRPTLLRGSVQGETVALALLGARVVHRRHGLIRSRSLYLNETGDPIFDSLTIEHNGLLVASTLEQAALGALIGWFAERGAYADELHISGSLLRAPETAVEASGLGRSEIVVPSYCVELRHLTQGGGELVPVLSANARQQLRRAIRYFERSGSLELRRAATVTEAHEFFAALKELHSASWERRGKPHAFTRAFFEPFHQLLIKRCIDTGATQLLRVSAGARAIGYLYNFRLNNHIYAYQSGFAYDEGAARPGVVTHALAITEAYRSGAVIYDFMAGRDRLKESFATRCEPMLWQVIQQPRLALRLEHFARRAKRAAGRALVNLRRRKTVLLP